jgi:hypothetical protein
VVIAGIVTDNAGPNQAAWKILTDTFPGLFAYGCASHGLHLLVKDILEKKPNVDNPFAELAAFTDRCKELVKFFCNVHAPKQALKELSGTSLVLPGETRWGSFLACFKSVRSNLGYLFTITSQAGFAGTAARFKRHRDAKEFICNADTASNLDKAIGILSPIDALIKKYQSNKVAISEVYSDWYQLTETLSKLPTLNPQERARAQELSTTRWNFIYNDAQGVAYLLDPRFAGAKMSEGDKDMTEQFVADYVALTDENVLIELDNDQKRARRGAAYAELDAFYEMIIRWNNTNNPRLDSMMSGSTNPYGFWVSNAEKFPIVSQVAKRVFSLVTTSAASERGFSGEGFVHSKLRNRLKSETVSKLMFVRTNAGVLDDVNVGHDDEDGDYAFLAENVDGEDEQGDIDVGEGEQGVVYELSDGE